jgi:glutamate/aspartate transport system substrate-binding protein
MGLKKQWVTLIVSSVLATSVYANNAETKYTGTLQKINKTGVVSVGHRESSIPFSYYDQHQKVVGYSQDYALKIVAAIRKKLGRPDIKMKLMPITSQNRIPLLRNGMIDFECGSTTNNLSRQKQAAFSNTIFIIGTRLLTKKNSGIHDFNDLENKTIVTTAGTTSERILRQRKNKYKIAHIISAKDHNQGFLMLETGRADAFMMDDALLASQRANAKEPGAFVLVGHPPSHEVYGCMLRKHDQQFKQLVDEVIAEVQLSGEGRRIYKKWFETPIPPHQINLDFPPSDEFKALFSHPNDRALD